MALALGTNVGFVTTAPTADPAGSNTTLDGWALVTKDTSPARAEKITEIGWYRGSGTNAANFEVGLYSDSAGVADARLYVDDTNSSTSGGWITVAVDWAIDPVTPYWLAVQMDAHTGSSTLDSATSGGSGIDAINASTTLNDPFGGGAVLDADGMYAIYALVELNETPTVALNSPADAGSTTDTTPTLDFTGTDTESNDIRYNIQIDTSNSFDSQLGSGPVHDTTVSQHGNGVNSMVFPAITTAEANEVLICEVHFSNTTPSGITFDGSLSWTKLGTEITIPTAGGEVYHYWALAPSVLSSVSFTATFTGGGFPQVSGHISAYKGVDVTAPIGDHDTGTANGTTTVSSTSVTTRDNSRVIALTGQTANNAMAAASGETEAAEVASVGGFSRSNSTYQDAVTANASTSVQMDVTTGVNTYMGMRSIELLAFQGPLIDKVSGTDAGFANPDTGGDTDPFNAGENIQYTVQSALSVGTTYYWRVRGIDPTGSNEYGSWATTRSFTVVSGQGAKVLNISQALKRGSYY